MKVGIFGGTFDPIHIGHLVVAEEARYKLGLDKVVFLPAGRPWFKNDRLITGGEKRLEMIKLGIKDNPSFDVSDIELNRDGPTYSVESIPALKEQYGGAELYFLLGMDALKDIHKWEQPDKIIEMCRVVGLTRPGYMAIDWTEIDSRIPGASQRIQTIEVSQVEVSSSDIRMMVANDMSIRFLVPDAVIKYIAKHGLYLHN